MRYIIITIFAVALYWMGVVWLSNLYLRESTDIRLSAILSKVSNDGNKADSLAKEANAYQRKSEKIMRLIPKLVRPH